MASTLFTLAVTDSDKESAIVDFLFAIGSTNLLVLHNNPNEIMDLILHIQHTMNTPCKVLINKGNRTTIVSPTHPDDNLKVIYCRTKLDSFAKALIREYHLPILLFHD
jgi:hypothetical protein